MRSALGGRPNRVLRTLSSCPSLLSCSFHWSSSPHVVVLHSSLSNHILYFTTLFFDPLATETKPPDRQLCQFSQPTESTFQFHSSAQPHHNTLFFIHIYSPLSNHGQMCVPLFSRTPSRTGNECGLWSNAFVLSTASRLHRLPQRLDYTLIPAPLGEDIFLTY